MCGVVHDGLGGLQAQSPARTWVPSERVKGRRECLRVLTGCLLSKYLLINFTRFFRCLVREVEATEDDLLDSTGVSRADSLTKLSSSGSPSPVRSKSPYCASHSARSGATYSGCR